MTREECKMGWSDDYGGYYPHTVPAYKPKQKHQWKSTLLITSTVYECTHCGVKKEEVIDEEYCEDNDNTGGW